VIAFLRGRLLEKHPNRIVLDVHGVGYDVHVPLSTYYGLPDTGADVSLRVHTHVREDALALFGFASAIELQIFERLIAVTGIGPRLALAVLSGIEPAELVRAVRGGDIGRLTAIPGIGRKTAERIGLELKDRLPATLAAETAPPAGVAEAPDLRADLVSALLNLGYHRAPAEQAVEAALAAGGASQFEPLLKHALRQLVR
jgi:Holliday junction DNA helicase RuvA